MNVSHFVLLRPYINVFLVFLFLTETKNDPNLRIDPPDVSLFLHSYISYLTSQEMIGRVFLLNQL